MSDCKNILHGINEMDLEIDGARIKTYKIYYLNIKIAQPLL